MQRLIPTGESIRSVKARVGSDAVDACDSSNDPARVPPSPDSPGRTPDACPVRDGWAGLPCCRFTPIESAPTAPWQVKFSPSFALTRHGWTSPLCHHTRTSKLLWPRLTSLVPCRDVATHGAKFAFAKRETSQGKKRLRRRMPAGSIVVRPSEDRASRSSAR